MRPVSHSLRFAIERHVLAVSHHADDFTRDVFVFHVDRHALTDRIFAGQNLPGESFVDYHDVSLLGRLHSVKRDPSERNLHRTEIVGAVTQTPVFNSCPGGSLRPAFDLREVPECGH